MIRLVISARPLLLVNLLGSWDSGPRGPVGQFLGMSLMLLEKLVES